MRNKFAIIILLVFIKCNTTENIVKSEIINYFYGKDKTSGVLISSYKNPKDYEKIIDIHRSIYGLNDDWTYFKEELNISEFDDSVYFVKYTCIFTNKISSDAHVVEKIYFVDCDTFSDPVPLKETNYFYIFQTKKLVGIKFFRLWRGDFDAYLEEHLQKSIIIDQ